MTIEKFIDEERDLLIMLLGITGLKLKVSLTDDGNGSRLKLSSRDLREREIQEIAIYAQDLELINDRLISIGYELYGVIEDRAVYRKPVKEFDPGNHFKTAFINGISQV